MNLEEMTQEGFVDTNQSFAGMKIYKKDDERILYKLEKDIAYLRYKIDVQYGKVKTTIKI